MLEMVLCQNGVGLEFGSSYSYSIRFLPSISVRLCLFPSFYFIQSSYKYTRGMKGQTFLQGSTSPARHLVLWASTALVHLFRRTATGACDVRFHLFAPSFPDV